VASARLCSDPSEKHLASQSDTDYGHVNKIQIGGMLMRATAGQQVVIASECLSIDKRAGTPVRSGVALPDTEGLPGGTA